MDRSPAVLRVLTFFGGSSAKGRAWLVVGDVVHGGHRAFGVAHAQPQILQGCKGLRAGDLMDQVQANEGCVAPLGSSAT